MKCFLSNKESKKRIYFAILILISITYFFVLDRKIYNNLPYPHHIDERHRLGPALKIIKTGDFHPGAFHKPSLPVYLTTIGLSAGFLRAAMQKKIRNVEQIGSVSYPYFDRPIIVLTANHMFALFSVLAILFTGLIIYKAFRNENFIFIPALIIPFSEIYWRKSFLYINVNILGAFFIALSLVYMFSNLAEKGVVKKSIIPGILCGLCLSAKFNLLAIYIPFFIAIFIYDRKNLLAYTLLLIVSSIVTIILLNPYYLLDFPGFLNHTAFQVNHYIFKGHKGFEGIPGTPQFIYYMNSIIDQFGITAFIISIAGIIYIFRLNWKNALLLISFPLGLLILMSAAKTNFLRNLTALYLLWPIFITMGAFFIYRLSKLVFTHFAFFKKESVVKSMSFFTVLFILSISLPFNTLRSNIKAKPDSRNEAVVWIQDNLKKGSVIIMPKDLQMDVRDLEKRHKVKILDREKIRYEYFRDNFIKENHYFLVPDYGYDSRKRKRKSKKQANFLNEQFNAIKDKVTLLKTFGTHKILVNYAVPNRYGNPKFHLMKVITSESEKDHN